VYKIIQTQILKNKFKHTKNLKFAKIILPEVREHVGEIAGNLGITLKASGNGKIVETHVSTHHHY
jgi:predicted transcriptional regulator